MTVSIRGLRAEDETDWHMMWHDYLAFYQVDLPAAHTEELFVRLLREDPHFGLIAEVNNRAAGFVLCLPHASTWSLSGYLYLEDLFVKPEMRGAGIGRALIEAVYAEADKRNLDRVYWHTNIDNKQARSLYDKLATLSDFVQYRRK